MTNKMTKNEMILLCNEFKKVNLVEFIEKETGKIFNKNHDRFSCLCPMAGHKDSQPSFNVYKDDNEGFGECWIYHCFGCGSGGTIIDFCMNYWSLESVFEVVLFLVEKLGIKETYEVMLKAIKDARIEVNLKKKINSEHFLASKRCYRLLKQYGQKKEVKEWVYNSYKEMNIMLAENNYKGIEVISNKALEFYKTCEMAR